MSDSDLGSADARLSWREMLSYASGSVASNLAWNFVAGFLIVYYTDEALIPVGTVGLLVLATRVFDALFDPLAGRAVDMTNTRWGKARPYLLWMSIPFGICCVLVFSIPLNWSLNARIAYAAITFGFLGLIYSFLYVPYGTLQPLLTSNKEQLLTVSGLRSMGTSVASIFVYVLALPAVVWFGGGAAGYRGAAVLFAAITALLYFVTFANCRERVVTTEGKDRSPIRLALPRMFANPIWRIVMAYEVLIFVRLGLLSSMMAFYAKVVIGSITATSVLLPALSCGILLGGFLSPAFLRRFGKRTGSIWVQIVTIAIFALVPIAGQSLPGIAAILFFGAIGNGIQASMAFALIVESTEYQGARFGSRDTGLLTSIAAFNQKVGFAIGSALLAGLLSLAGYTPQAAGPESVQTLVWLMCLGPITIAVLQIITISFYRFDNTDVRTAALAAAN